MKWYSLILGVSCLALCALAAPEDSRWGKVKTAMDQGLPKSAIKELEPIIASAIEQKKWPEAIRGVTQRIALEGNIEGNKPEEKIIRMQAEIEKSPAEMRPVMRTILAHWHWHYFQHNRGRFMGRTQTAAAPGEDLTTWDLPRILREIDVQFAEALKDSDALKKIKVEEYADLLPKGTVPDTYRPTLYDVLVQSALEFYLAGEQAGNQSEDAFELSADSPIFSGREEFINWKPQAEETDRSPKLQAIRLFQELLRFHAKDTDKSARLDVDLQRLEFGKNFAVGEEKEERYVAALRRLQEGNLDHELSSRAAAMMAQQMFDDEDRVAAHEVASEGKQRFPESRGGHECHNLMERIEAPECNIVTERVWNQPTPEIAAHYRNINHLYFRAIPFDFEAWLGKPNRYLPMHLNSNELKQWIDKKPALAWDTAIPETDDYQLRTETIKVPEGLKPGSYYLIASHTPDFSDQKNIVSLHDIWVSDIALIIRTQISDEAPVADGFVLHAVTGEPLANAEVRLYTRDRNGQLKLSATTKTDPSGLYRIASPVEPNQGYQQHLLYAVHKLGKLVSGEQFWMGEVGDIQSDHESTLLFTDRAIYRPGQTIHYKGISVFSNQRTNEYRTLGKRQVRLVFTDVNGKEIETQSHVTNDYGSFSGSMTAPRDRLMGAMSLRVAEGPEGFAQVTVEEYKRPKFQVKLESPQDAPKLGEEVEVVGKAIAYTGAAIDGSKVQWRVVRKVRYPDWWYWRFWFMPSPSNEGQEIAHGTVTTDEQGNFTVRFTARPDKSVAEKDEPIFEFAITADVTDSAGETRSDEREVRVGYASIKATLSAESWQVIDRPVEISVQTSTLDGEGQASKGELKIYRLVSPEKVQRPSLTNQGQPPRPLGSRRYARSRTVKIGLPRPVPDNSNLKSWELGEVVHTETIETDASGKKSTRVALEVGAYRATYEAVDRFGKKVTAERPLLVLDPDAKRFEIKVPDSLESPSWKIEPGQEFLAIWGTGYDTGRAYVEIVHRNKVVRSYWTKAGETQTQIREKVSDSYRGGFQLRVTYVRENRAYFHTHRIDVPWSNKELKIKWEHFVSKLEPGVKEKWTAVITGPDAEQAVAEMVATLYDASLEQFMTHSWAERFDVFYEDQSYILAQFENVAAPLQHVLGSYPSDYRPINFFYRHLPDELIASPWNYGYGMAMRFKGARVMAPMSMAAPGAASDRMAVAENHMMSLSVAADADGASATRGAAGGEDDSRDVGGTRGPDLSQVSPRKNLQETAFFFPHLISSKAGEVRIEFQMPEALTEWNFLGFAHDRELRSGFLKDKTVTAKDIMVQPNPPRFLREGDTLAFTAKVTNQSATRQSGTVQLKLADGRTGKDVTDKYGLDGKDLTFDLASKASASVSWSLKVPDDAGVLQYTVVGSTGRLSDGEEGFLPVLSNRILVTESLPLPIRGAQTKDFEFTRLKDAKGSDTIKHQSLTVQMVSNPSWYAVMSLPYLMEYPYDCSEQTFNRLYANLLARHIAKSDPKIHRVFEQWRGTKTLTSPLEQNQDLKSVMIEETPWLRDAEKESQQRRNVGILFDDNRMESEVARLSQKVAEMQLESGWWSWFPGGPENKYITLYIVTGYARLRHLGVEVDMAPAIRSVSQLDAWADEQYKIILEAAEKSKNAKKPEENHLSTTAALYLYCRSFYLKDVPIEPQHKAAVDYWRQQAKDHWLKLGYRQSQAHMALALHRFGDKDAAQGIMRSIKERSVTQEEMGMFWRDTEYSWWWFHAPIETQAMMIEAFDEVMDDAQAVEDCKVWLLKQKQTTNWKTTKGTSDAIYALLLRGTDQLASDALVEVTVGGEVVRPESVEAGTGFYEQKWTRGEIKPEQGEVTVKKSDPGVAWGSMHWQYLEDMSKVTPYEGTPLKLKKSLFTKQASKEGPVLKGVTGAVAVGDELVVRVELRVDRDMEYVHLKDYRGSGTEPVNVLSRYKFQDGLAYYESTRDTASHFFIDYLPKGVYVFEYSTRVQHRGKYQTGVAEIQCMYAPEFNSHSESVWLSVE